MTREIKFTSFGIPYILEFENVSFVPERRRQELRPKYTQSHDSPSLSPEPYRTLSTVSPSPASSTSSFCYIESPPPPPRFPSFSLRSASSFFKRKPTQHPSHIHSPPPHIIPSRTSNDTTTENSLWFPNLEHTKPLPPPPQSDVSETHGIYIQFPPQYTYPRLRRKERLVHLQQTISAAVLDAGMSGSPGNTTHLEKHSNENSVHQTRGHKTADALFCGTYGQLMAAFEGAGLSATPCAEGLSGYTRLGALFVARNDGGSGVQLRKITLWG